MRYWMKLTCAGLVVLSFIAFLPGCGNDTVDSKSAVGSGVGVGAGAPPNLTANSQPLLIPYDTGLYNIKVLNLTSLHFALEQSSSGRWNVWAIPGYPANISPNNGADLDSWFVHYDFTEVSGTYSFGWKLVSTARDDITPDPAGLQIQLTQVQSDNPQQAVQTSWWSFLQSLLPISSGNDELQTGALPGSLSRRRTRTPSLRAISTVRGSGTR